ncbi:beta-xylosidase [Marasmius fiardii PR-910]|nr:beta-xylosidase [Marasmius fiardii PR-910]
MTFPQAVLRTLVVGSIALTCEGAFPDCVNGPLSKTLVCDTTAASIDRARALANELTVSELIQNTVNQSPGVSRLGLPPYNWWSEALHGVALSPGVTFAQPGNDFSLATSFPAPITLGAGFDDELVNAAATIISTEARAFNNFNRSGLDFFTPNINPFKDPRWGRGQETPGEDPFHIAQYVFQYVTGLQGGIAPTPYLKVMADCKHWAAYDLEDTPSGITRHTFDAQVSQQDLAEYYSPPFQSCIRDAKVGSIMCSYNAVNGVPSCANRFLLQDLVRDLWELGTEQWITSDCGAVEDIFDTHHFTSTIVNATAVALRAGTDIECGTAYSQNLQAALNQSLISEADLRQSLTRQFNSLIRLGYFDPPEQQPFRQLSFKDINTPAAQQLAYQAAVEGIVLLKNDGILPLRPSIKRIAVIGPWANATDQMQSNYQGVAPFLISPLAAFRNAGFTVNFAQGTSISTTSTSNFSAALTAARNSDAVFYVGGIDRTIEGESHDRSNISWPGNQLDLVNQLSGLGKPFVVLQMGGGQVDSSSIKANSKVNALIWGGYPGQSGGTALVDIITGKQSPAGRLPTTQYPAAYINQVAFTDMSLRPSSSSPGRTYKWYTGNAVFEFGFGLHYTTFAFTWGTAGPNTYNIQSLVQAAQASADVSHVDLGTLDTFTVSVRNTGKASSDYVALLFSHTTAGPSPAPKKELVSYTRVKGIKPGQTGTAKLKVTLGAVARTDEEGNRVLYPGSYELQLDTNGVIKRTITLTGTEAKLIAWPKAS